MLTIFLVKIRKLSFKKIWNSFSKALIYVIAIFLLSWLIKGTILSVYQVPTGSMYPTIKRGDFIFVLKFPYFFKTPKKYPLIDNSMPSFEDEGIINLKMGDLIVFSSTLKHDGEKEQLFIKRITGMPGDTLYINFNSKKVYSIKEKENSRKIIIPREGHEVKINEGNRKLWKELIRLDNIFTNKGEQYKEYSSYSFRNNFYYIEGDNSKKSYDSRFYGPIPSNAIEGKAFLILWSDYRDQMFSLL